VLERIFGSKREREREREDIIGESRKLDNEERSLHQIKEGEICEERSTH
jgi:hypothetical protein